MLKPPDREPHAHARGAPLLRAGRDAVTGETGAGATIFAQAIGLLLGTRVVLPANPSLWDSKGGPSAVAIPADAARLG